MNKIAKDLIELLKAIFLLQEALSKSWEDKKISFRDAFNFLAIADDLEIGFDGLGNIPNDFKAYPEETKVIVMDYFRDHFDLPNDELEALIERSLQFAIDGYSLAGDWVKHSNKAA